MAYCSDGWARLEELLDDSFFKVVDQMAHVYASDDAARCHLQPCIDKWVGSVGVVDEQGRKTEQVMVLESVLWRIFGLSEC